jgi:hypothetical protein
MEGCMLIIRKKIRERKLLLSDFNVKEYLKEIVASEKLPLPSLVKNIIIKLI